MREKTVDSFQSKNVETEDNCITVTVMYVCVAGTVSCCVPMAHQIEALLTQTHMQI